MSLDVFAVSRPGQLDGTGVFNALHIEQAQTEVENTMKRVSKLRGWIKPTPLRGTSVLQAYATGQATMQRVTPGTTPNGAIQKHGRTSVTVDTRVHCRNYIDKLDLVQNPFDALMAFSKEHGNRVSKFYDEHILIQAVKAAQSTTNRYGLTGASGQTGGTQVTFAAAADAQDPGRLYQALLQMITGMQEKDVDPHANGTMFVMRPREWALIQQDDRVIDSAYITSEGNSVNAQVLKGWGIPIICSNDLPNTNITGSLLSNAANTNAYDGDFTKVVALAFTPKALLFAEAIPLTTEVQPDMISKSTIIDTEMAFGLSPNRADHAAVLLLP